MAVIVSCQRFGTMKEASAMNLRISTAEREELIKMVAASISNTRIEIRHTRTPEWHDQLREEERRLSTLLGKLTKATH